MDDKLKIIAVVSKKFLRKFKRSSKQHIMSNILKVCFIKKTVNKYEVFFLKKLFFLKAIFLHFVLKLKLIKIHLY